MPPDLFSRKAFYDAQHVIVSFWTYPWRKELDKNRLSGRDLVKIILMELDDLPCYQRDRKRQV
jgi:hypothetical protein